MNDLLERLMEYATEISQAASTIRNGDSHLNIEARDKLDFIHKQSDKIWNGVYKIKNL